MEARQARERGPAVACHPALDRTWLETDHHRVDMAVRGVLNRLLSRRIIFVTGKGGTGKSTVAAALALLASQADKRVLCVDVDAKGDLSRLLGAEPVGFKPRLVQPNVSALAMHPEESLQEYLAVYFKVPRLMRLTPLARVFDFVATGVPGTKEMLIIGKIAYEERRSESGRPAWDIIIVDGAASGHVLPQLRAARSMMELTRGGIIRSQTEWVDLTLSDPLRTLLVICALPEEMPVVEAIELHDRANQEAHVGLGACFLDCTFPVGLTAHQSDLLERLVESHRQAAEARLGGPVQPLLDGVKLARRLHEESDRHARTLRRRLSVPVVEIPRQVAATPGMAMTRAVASALARAAS
jgi:anion-transporting  ArsA/GET3 family ATPase